PFPALVVEAIAPAVLIVRAGHPEVAIQRERASIIDRTMREKARNLLYGVEVAGNDGARRGRNVVLRIARAIARLKHGGAILIVRADSEECGPRIKTIPRDAATPQRPLSLASKLLRDAFDAHEQLEAQKPRDEAQLRIASEWLGTAIRIEQAAVDDLAVLANM